jgi:predicted Zn-dependent protease
MRLPVVAAALLASTSPAAAQSLDPVHEEQAKRAQDVTDRMESGNRTSGDLAAARALREECLASGNHRSAEFLAGRITANFPTQVRDRHRFVDILLARGKTAQAEQDLRDLLKERPSDCIAYGMLAELLAVQGQFGRAMEIHAAHLNEHAGEAGPLYGRAHIALWSLRDGPLAREAAAAMVRAAKGPSLPKETADFLVANAARILEGAERLERDRVVLRDASARVDGILWRAMAGGVLALCAAAWFTRRRM